MTHTTSAARHLSIVADLVPAPVAPAHRTNVLVPRTHFAVTRNGIVEVVLELTDALVEEMKVESRKRNGQIGSDGRPMTIKLTMLTAEHAAKIQAKFALIQADLQIIDDSRVANKERFAAFKINRATYLENDRKCVAARERAFAAFDSVIL